jgi:hypothetical protein
MPITTREGGKMTTSTANRIYGKLLAKALPKVIQSEKENDRYMKTLLALEQKATPTPEEKDLADLLTPADRRL